MIAGYGAALLEQSRIYSMHAMAKSWKMENLWVMIAGYFSVEWKVQKYCWKVGRFKMCGL
jgi:hypothetical protein